MALSPPGLGQQDTRVVARTVQYPTGTKIAPVLAWASGNFFITRSTSPVSHDSEQGVRQERAPGGLAGSCWLQVCGADVGKTCQEQGTVLPEHGRAGDGFWGQDGSRGSHHAHGEEQGAPGGTHRLQHPQAGTAPTPCTPLCLRMPCCQQGKRTWGHSGSVTGTSSGLG